jgi:hypothetical protein
VGYTTEFEGTFTLNSPLTELEAEYLRKFSGTRRMQRNTAEVEKLPDPVREAVKLPVSHEGAYFVGGAGWAGQDRDDSIVEYNDPPHGQPGLWCQWVPTEDLKGIEWDGNEKFYSYVEWLEYIIENFLKPWGYTLNGEVRWRGEEFSDIGVITVKDNAVST